eukprot:2239789-Rhodomonas_salina.4
MWLSDEDAEDEDVDEGHRDPDQNLFLSAPSRPNVILRVVRRDTQNCLGSLWVGVRCLMIGKRRREEGGGVRSGRSKHSSKQQHSGGAETSCDLT